MDGSLWVTDNIGWKINGTRKGMSCSPDDGWCNRPAQRTPFITNPQPFWHEGLVLWKTVFSGTRDGQGYGSRMIQAHHIYCTLYFYYHYISSSFRSSGIRSRGLGAPDGANQRMIKDYFLPHPNFSLYLLLLALPLVVMNSSSLKQHLGCCYLCVRTPPSVAFIITVTTVESWGRKEV